MEEVLESLGNNEDQAKSRAAIQLLKVYINNVVQNPSNVKYRKIKISNPKFHSIIWVNEDARSFLFLAGFEQNGDFLILPDGVCLDGVKIILDNASLEDGPSSSKNIPRSTSTTQNSSNYLKLRKSTDATGSMFDEVVKADMTLLSYMEEMGFDVKVAEKALIITKNKGVQPAIDWINNNPKKVNEIKMAGSTKTNESTNVLVQKIYGGQHQPVQQVDETAPVSRFHTTIDERHRFQEKLRLEAIQAARLEKAEQRRQKEYLLKNLEDERKERKEKDERIKCMRMSESCTRSSSSGETSVQSETTQEGKDGISLKLRLPDGKVTGLKVQTQSPLGSIYRHISHIGDLKEDEFTIMTFSPQRKLNDKEKNIDELGLKSHETLIVQRVHQTGNITQGHGEIFQIMEVETVEQWQTLLAENTEKLIVVEFYVTWSAQCKRSAQQFEALNTEFGFNNRAKFVKVNIDSLPTLKNEYNIEVFPMYKLVWNKETLCDIHGFNREKLCRIIRENLREPEAESVADDKSEDYFDPR